MGYLDTIYPAKSLFLCSLNCVSAQFQAHNPLTKLFNRIHSQLNESIVLFKKKPFECILVKNRQNNNMTASINFDIGI